MKTIRVADLFCGAGGATLSMHRAIGELGLKADLLAVNHWPRAVETHRLNNPDAVHLCEAVDKVDPKTLVFTDPLTGKTFKPKGRLELLMAGPECTHHSTARGGRPMNNQSRHSAWHILKFAQELYIDNILIENVPEFKDWGPLGANGRPMKSCKGETYRAFLDALRSLGYTVEDKVLNAADYGDPTTRRRLFIIARRGKHPIQWPEPSHSRSGDNTLFGGRKRWRAAREVIDWSLKGKSIFNRKKPLSPKTMARIMAGLDRFGGPDLKPFLIVMRNHADARSLDRPLPAVTATGQHFGLVEPGACIVPVTHAGGFDRAHSVDAPMTTVTGANRGELALVESSFVVANNENNQPKSVDEPLATVTTGSRLYKADVALEPFVLQQQSGGVPRSAEDPLPTIATDGAQMLVEPFMVSAGGPKVSARPVSQPMNTVLTRDHMALVDAVIQPFLVQPCHGGGDARRVKSVDEPLGTLPCSNRFAVVEADIQPAPFVVTMEHRGSVRDIESPLPTITTAKGGAFAVVEPFIVGAGGPARAGEPKSVSEPMGTVMTRQTKAVIEPFLVPHYGEGPGQSPRTHSIDEPVPTIPASGAGKFELAEAFIIGAGGAEYAGKPKSVDDPVGTLTAHDHRALVEASVDESFVTTYYGNGGISSVSEPLPTITTKDRCALVAPIINGRKLDIRLRMLKPHELAQAMSFSKDYEFTGNQGEKVKQIGNAWPCALGEALITSILAPYAAKRRTPQPIKATA